MRVKIKKGVVDKEFLAQMGFKLDMIYKGIKKDNGYIEIRGFEFEENELEVLN